MKGKTVSNLLLDIGTARDLIEEKDLDKINKNLKVFERVQEGVRTHFNRNMKDPNHELDFNCYDLQELSDEICEYIKNFHSKFTFNALLNEIKKKAPIDDDKFHLFVEEQKKKMRVEARLGELQKLSSFASIVLYLLELKENSESLDSQLTKLINDLKDEEIDNY